MILSFFLRLSKRELWGIISVDFLQARNHFFYKINSAKALTRTPVEQKTEKQLAS